MTKAAVFPDPVGAEARISRPKNRLHNMKENRERNYSTALKIQQRMLQKVVERQK
jgi:hypothetical protein